jgi:predicted nucleic acid-binding protein
MGALSAIAPSIIYLDTNIFIYAVEDFKGLGVKLRPLFARFDSGECRR